MGAGASAMDSIDHMEGVAIGIDLGGTRIKALAMGKSGQIHHQMNLPTQDGNDQVWKDAVAKSVAELRKKIGTGNVLIGLSAPGLPDADNLAIDYMPGRMQGLEGFVWRDFLKQPAWVLNDGVSALIAEANLGSAKDRKNAVMLTLGTGVGGAILINGQPYLGSFSKAGHMGHMVIHDDGDPDVTGMPGSLEECIGNVTLGKRSGGKFLSTMDLLEASRKGDSFASEVWLTSVRKLAVGIASITNILSPEVIVLGGGITEANDDLFGPLKTYLDQYEWRAGGNGVEIVKATFGDISGAMGAALFAMNNKPG